MLSTWGGRGFVAVEDSSVTGVGSFTFNMSSLLPCILINWSKSCGGVEKAVRGVVASWVVSD